MTKKQQYGVFIQTKNGLAHKHVECMQWQIMALENARDLYTRRSRRFMYMGCKSSEIISSESEDSEAFFDPSNDKMYRHPTFYNMPDGAKHI